MPVMDANLGAMGLRACVWTLCWAVSRRAGAPAAPPWALDGCHQPPTTATSGLPGSVLLRARLQRLNFNKAKPGEAEANDGRTKMLCISSSKQLKPPEVYTLHRRPSWAAWRLRDRLFFAFTTHLKAQNHR